MADIDRNHYDNLNLTLAQHPSETLARMMARVLAFCMNAQESFHHHFRGSCLCFS
ncbi:MAG: YaeQ family protein [Desulfobacula sp.]|nr:YaeQ family protein [Desulfobacula sp.]